MLKQKKNKDFIVWGKKFLEIFNKSNNNTLIHVEIQNGKGSYYGPL
jgi:hypothetical protein